VRRFFSTPEPSVMSLMVPRFRGDKFQLIAVVVEGPSSLRPAPRSGVATAI
jgi:hypothetical protein